MVATGCCFANLEFKNLLSIDFIVYFIYMILAIYVLVRRAQ